MQISHAQQQAITAATLSLVVFGACVMAFLPPFNQHVLSSVPYTVLLGLGIGVSFILHLVFIGVAAQRLGRSALVWVVLALFTFPLASIVGLILFEWFSAEGNGTAERRAG